MDADNNLREAVRLLDVYSGGNGRFDVWAIAGRSRASCRAHVMSVLQGRKIPQSKSGVYDLRAALWQAAGIDGGCIAEKDERFTDFCRSLLVA